VKPSGSLLCRRLILSGESTCSKWTPYAKPWVLRGYGQKDPLIEYKSEGYEIFLDMMTGIRRNVVYTLFQFQPQTQPQVKTSQGVG